MIKLPTALLLMFAATPYLIMSMQPQNPDSLSNLCLKFLKSNSRRTECIGETRITPIDQVIYVLRSGQLDDVLAARLATTLTADDVEPYTEEFWEYLKKFNLTSINEKNVGQDPAHRLWVHIITLLPSDFAHEHITELIGLQNISQAVKCDLVIRLAILKKPAMYEAVAQQGPITDALASYLAEQFSPDHAIAYRKKQLYTDGMKMHGNEQRLLKAHCNKFSKFFNNCTYKFIENEQGIQLMKQKEAASEAPLICAISSLDDILNFRIVYHLIIQFLGDINIFQGLLDLHSQNVTIDQSTFANRFNFWFVIVADKELYNAHKALMDAIKEREKYKNFDHIVKEIPWMCRLKNCIEMLSVEFDHMIQQVDITRYQSQVSVIQNHVTYFKEILIPMVEKVEKFALLKKQYMAPLSHNGELITQFCGAHEGPWDILSMYDFGKNSAEVWLAKGKELQALLEQSNENDYLPTDIMKIKQYVTRVLPMLQESMNPNAVTVASVRKNQQKQQKNKKKSLLGNCCNII